MLFGHPSAHEASTLKSLLDLFAKASGMIVNASKSQIFSFNTAILIQHRIARILRFSISSLLVKYLRAPLIVSALKHSSWRSLLDKLEASLSSWTFRPLNLPSRLILVKSVLQSMPLYLFSVLAAPKWVLKQIRSLQRNFLWGAFRQNRKWALVKWNIIRKPKLLGGLGLHDPQHSNTIMGAKVWWQWLSSPSSPWAKL